MHSRQHGRRGSCKNVTKARDWVMTEQSVYWKSEEEGRVGQHADNFALSIVQRRMDALEAVRWSTGKAAGNQSQYVKSESRDHRLLVPSAYLDADIRNSAVFRWAMSRSVLYFYMAVIRCALKKVCVLIYWRLYDAQFILLSRVSEKIEMP
jgi:hypothetical protein